MGHPEGCDAEDLNLPGLQPQLVEAILETGTPTVLLAVSGRPYALGQYQGRAAAIVQAFFPGEEGGSALAGVLSGRVNPSGKLPVGVPRQAGGQPHTYLAPPLGQRSQRVSNLDPTPAFPFGHGLVVHLVRLGQCERQRGRARHSGQRRADGHCPQHRSSLRR